MNDNILSTLEKLETKLAKANGLAIAVGELRDRMTMLEQKGGALPGEGMTTKANGTLGDLVVKGVQDNADLLNKAGKLRLDVKAAGDVTGTSSVRNIVSGGAGVPAGMVLGFHNAMTQRRISGTSAVEYSRFLAVEGAAAKQASEGAAKSAVRPTFSLIVQPGLTVAGFSKVSKQALTDSAELQRAIDITLRRSIVAALDDILTTGSWGGANGILAHATAYTSLVYTNLADAASEAVARLQTAGFVPDVVVMQPDDWLAITTATASGSGEYLSGAYLSQLPELLRGLKVVLSPTITAGKCLVADSSQMELLVVDDMTVEIGTDADDFTKNVRTILGEMRVIPTFRAVGAARLITPKA